MGFAENVRSELEYKDIQVKELAAMTGISKNTLDKYLSGKKVQPGVENAVKIAASLGVTVEYLVTGKNEVDPLPEFRKEINLIVRQYTFLNQFNRKTVEDLIKSLAARQ